MTAPLRVLFCIGINQNFFDLPTGQGGAVWKAILADVDTQETVKAVCNLFRTIPVGEHSLWRYAKVEARMGRPLVVRDDVILD